MPITEKSIQKSHAAASVSHSQRLEHALPHFLKDREISLCLQCLWQHIDVCRLAYSQQTHIRIVVPGEREGERWLACFRVPTVAVRAWAHQPRAVINLHDWGVLLEARMLASGGPMTH